MAFFRNLFGSKNDETQTNGLENASFAIKLESFIKDLLDSDSYIPRSSYNKFIAQ